jgi:hypothetical protein
METDIRPVNELEDEEEFDDNCAEIFDQIEELTSKYQDYISEVTIGWKKYSKDENTEGVKA